MSIPHNREKEIFEQALDVALCEERLAFVKSACGKDAVLCARVCELLRAHSIDSGFLPNHSEDVISGGEHIGDRIGRYLLIEKIGEGGCGIVYLADQEEPVRRHVALKVIKLGMDTREVVGRFEAERQALAMMDHPNIAQVYDGGATESGRPYFVLELVHGERITEFCDHRDLSTVARLELFMQVCEAIQHAHQKGIIHRDIKPSNILVSQRDGDSPGVSKVIDFGIAKAVGERLTDKAFYTSHEQFVGTPAYMSPEQAGHSDLDVDTRGDIYALGVLLYELLTGKTPFDDHDLLKSGLDVMLRTIREKEPLRPSLRLARELAATTARKRKTPASQPTPAGQPVPEGPPPFRYQQTKRRIHSVRGDLDWIVMKCLEKDRTQRYETVQGLMLDVQKHLRNEPVSARPPSTAYQLGKFFRRNRRMVTTGLAVSIALVMTLIGMPVALLKLSRERQLALLHAAGESEQRKIAEIALQRLQVHTAEQMFDDDKAADGLAVLASALRRDSTNRVIAHRIVNELTQRSFPLPVIAPIRHEDGVHHAEFSPDGTALLTVCRNNTARVWDTKTGRALTPQLTHDQSVIHSGEYLEGLHPLHADISADGTKVATASVDGTAQVWDVRTGRALGEPLRHGNVVSWIRFSPNSQLLATACKDGKVRLWSLNDSKPAGPALSHGDWVNSVEFSPNGQWLVSACDDCTAQVWAVRSGEKRGEPMRHSHWVTHACFSPDGRRIVTASHDATARVWDAATGLPMTRPLTHDHIVAAACFSPDGRWVATASFDRSARIWDVLTGEPVGRPLQHRGVVRWVAFGPEGLRIVTASEDGTARVWDASSGRPITEPMLHGGIVWSAQFSPDGERVATASTDGTARIWDVRPGQAMALRIPHSSGVKFAQWSGDGRRVYTSGGYAWGWDASTGTNQLLLWGGVPGRAVSTSSLSPNGCYLATVLGNNYLRLWDIPRNREVQIEAPGLAGAILATTFSPDSLRLATTSADRTAQVWDIDSGRSVGQPLRHDDVVFNAQFRRDGRQLVTASADGTARVWDAESGSQLFAPFRHGGMVVWVRFSPDGALIATASADRTARLWNAQTGEAMGAPLAHEGAVNTVEFSADGTHLVTASADHTAQVWKVRDGTPACGPLVHEAPVVMAEFSPDSRVVLTASKDGTARLWDADTGQPIAEPLRHIRSVTAAHFSPDGRWVVTASEDWTAAIWRVTLIAEPPPAWLAGLAEAVAGKRLTPTGMMQETPANELLQIEQSSLRRDASGEYERLAAWFFGDRRRRPIAPDASIAVADILSERVERACHKPTGKREFLEELLFYQPTNVLLLARLAQLQVRWNSAPNASALVQLDWLSRRAMELSPQEPLAQWCRALILARQGDTPAALRMMKQLFEAGFKDTCFLVDYMDALVTSGRVSEAFTIFRQTMLGDYEESELENHLRQSYRNDWAKVARNQISPLTRVFQFVAEGVPPRRADESSPMLDLHTAYGLGQLWVNTGASLDGLNDFLEQPVKIGAVSFDARGAIHPLRQSPDPLFLTEVPVKRLCRRLHFLQTSLSKLEPGTRAGSYIVRYVQGKCVEIPIIYGTNVCAFVTPAGEAPDAVRASWEHKSADGSILRMCTLMWDNPRPADTIDRIQFQTERFPCAPVLIGITAEP